MKQILTLLSIVFISLSVSAQSDAQRVYDIFQTHCSTAGCHNNIDAEAGLDLEGTGATLAAKMQSVYNNVYKVTPSNSEADAKKNYLIYPGDPYRSYIYRKMDNGLSPDVHLTAGEGAVEPQGGGSMTDLEIETVRQWILYGAKANGTNYDYSVIEDYYTNGGIESVQNVPAAPAPEEGFQLHVGPFYIAAGDEVEFMSKYETALDETTEITKFQTEMGDFSHHFIVYNFVDMATGAPLAENDVPVGYGLRSNVGFDDKGFVITEQYSNTLELPPGTAFEWQTDLVLDLNSHYINYSTTEVLKCEVYLNVYTQDAGEATQIMYSQLIPNTNIPIPNDNQEHVFDFYLPYEVGQFINPLFQDPMVHLWGLIAHTHQYGKDFDVSKNGTQIYDGGCANGLPGCAVEDFDYQHLPFRFYDPFVSFGSGDNLTAQAKYVNDGPNSVGWGLTSDDEMMIFVIFFTLDTAGLNDITDPSSINTLADNQSISFYPNPVSDKGLLNISNMHKGEINVKVYNIAGREVWQAQEHIENDLKLVVPTDNWNKGLYVYKVEHNNIPVYSGKFAVE